MDKIIIPVVPKSLNQLLRSHWSYKGKLKREYQLLVVNQMRLNKIRKTEIGEAWNVTIYSYRTKLLDMDNLVGGCKPILDALSMESFIWDDSDAYLLCRYFQKTAPKGRRYTEIIREKIETNAKR